MSSYRTNKAYKLILRPRIVICCINDRPSINLTTAINLGLLLNYQATGSTSLRGSVKYKVTVRETHNTKLSLLDYCLSMTIQDALLIVRQT